MMSPKASREYRTQRSRSPVIRPDVSVLRKATMSGACLTHGRLLRPPLIGIFLRSFHLHSVYYARETIPEICSMRGALAPAPMSHPPPLPPSLPHPPIAPP